MPITTFVHQHRQPYSFSDRPAPAPATYPIVEVGDEVTLDGPWSGDPVTCKVTAATADHKHLTVDYQVAMPGNGPVEVGVWHVLAVTRGAERWARS